MFFFFFYKLRCGLMICSEIKELVSELALIKRECGITDPDLIPLAQWKIQSSSSHSHGASSAVSSKLREEIDQIKR